MLRSFIVAVLLGASVSAQSPPPADALKACVMNNTSGQDRKDLATWMFLAMAAHPETKPHTSANVAAAADANSRTVAALMTRLLIDSCPTEARAAIQAGQGAQSLNVALEGLGQLAIQELMTDQSVRAALSAFDRYVDHRRITEALAPK